jgi:hypothetical protein
VQPPPGLLRSSWSGFFALRRIDVHIIMVATRRTVKSNFLMSVKRKIF